MVVQNDDFFCIVLDALSSVSLALVVAIYSAVDTRQSHVAHWQRLYRTVFVTQDGAGEEKECAFWCRTPYPRPDSTT